MHNLHSYQPHKIDQSLDIKYQNYVFGFDFCTLSFDFEKRAWKEVEKLGFTLSER